MTEGKPRLKLQHAADACEIKSAFFRMLARMADGTWWKAFGVDPPDVWNPDHAQAQEFDARADRELADEAFFESVKAETPVHDQ